MRFSEPFQHKPGLNDEQKLEAERLMFMELTQSAFYFSCTLERRLIIL